jgi:competence protein ComGF
LESKNKDALTALLIDKRFKIINYQDLASISKMFHVQFKKNEKYALIDINKSKKSGKNHSSQGNTLQENGNSLAFLYFRKYKFSLIYHIYFKKNKNKVLYLPLLNTSLKGM